MSADDRTLTVAKVRSREDADYVEVLFLESARIYKLPRKQPRFDELLHRLQVAEREGQLVNLALASPRSDVIEDVRIP